MHVSDIETLILPWTHNCSSAIEILFQEPEFATCSDLCFCYDLIQFFLQDANPLGEIILGTTADKFSVDEEPLAGEYSFTLHTPFRDFPLIADNSEEKMQWVKAFQSVLENLEEMVSGSPRARCSTYELETKY